MSEKPCPGRRGACPEYPPVRSRAGLHHGAAGPHMRGIELLVRYRPWLFGGASGVASMSRRIVTQMSRSCGCSRARCEQRVCGPGDVVVIPGGTDHEAWFREDTEVIDFFAPPREDFLLGGKPAYMSEG